MLEREQLLGRDLFFRFQCVPAVIESQDCVLTCFLSKWLHETFAEFVDRGLRSRLGVEKKVCKLFVHTHLCRGQQTHVHHDVVGGYENR